MKYLDLQGVSTLWSRSLQKFSLATHTHDISSDDTAGFVPAGFLSAYANFKDHMDEDVWDSRSSPNPNLLYNTNYRISASTSGATYAARSTEKNDSMFISIFNSRVVTLSIRCTKTIENVEISGYHDIDHIPTGSNVIGGAQLVVDTESGDTYTLDLPLTTSTITDMSEISKDYVYSVTSIPLPKDCTSVTVYYGFSASTSTAGALTIRRPKLEFGYTATPWMLDTSVLQDTKLSTSGGTMTGTLTISGTYYPSLYLTPTYTAKRSNKIVFEGSYVGEASFAVWDDSNGNNRRMLTVRSANYDNSGSYGFDNAVILRYAVEGTYSSSRVFHEAMETPIPIKNGGTGAVSSHGARENLRIFVADTLPDTGADGDICILY